MPLTKGLGEKGEEGIDNHLSFGGWESLSLEIEEGYSKLPHPFSGLDMEENNFSGVRFHIVGDELSRTPIYESGKEFVRKKYDIFYSYPKKVLNIETIVKQIKNHDLKSVFVLVKGNSVVFYKEVDNNSKEIETEVIDASTSVDKILL